MDQNNCTILSNIILMEIIKIQSDIVKLGHDLGNVMEMVAKSILDIAEAQGAIVELVENDEMVYRAASGSAAAQLGLRLNKASSLSGLCVENRKVLICDDSETDQRVDRDACRKVGLRSMVVAPLLHGESAVGVLKIVSPMPNAFSDKHICILTMMTELIAASMYYASNYEINALYHKSTHDMLTGIANRALFYDRLRQGLALVGRRSAGLCVLNLDMDNLKSINDMHGHRVGDAAIKEFAIRTTRVTRESDTVARLGGDEFGVILTDVRDRKAAEETAARIADAIRPPFEFENATLSIDASMGMAMYPQDGSGIEELLEKADKAMYQMKRTRKQIRSATL